VLKKDHLITTIIYNFTKLAASIFIAHLLTINSTLRNSKTMWRVFNQLVSYCHCTQTKPTGNKNS